MIFDCEMIFFTKIKKQLKYTTLVCTCTCSLQIACNYTQLSVNIYNGGHTAEVILSLFIFIPMILEEYGI